MFASYGTRQIRKYALLTLIALLILVLLAGFVSPVWGWLTILLLLEFGFVLYFFRDPERAVPDQAHLLVSPADGVVTHLEECDDPGCLGGKAIRLSIFLSVFDVHLNRAVFPGEVFHVKYKEGEFLNAMNHDSLHRNECNDLGVATTDPRLPKYCLRQIAGLIARRIDCLAKVGDRLARGERYGMMKFSSRTDLFVPAGTKLCWKVKIGDKVRAGSTVIGELEG